MARRIGGLENRGSGANAEMRAINERLVISAIREQELAEAAQRAEQRVRDLIRGLGAVVCEVDSASRRTNFLSMHGDTFLGRPSDEWRREPDFLSAIAHADDRDRCRACIADLHSIGREYEYEFRAVSEDARPIWMRNIVRPVRDPGGSQIVLRCVIVDITSYTVVARALEDAYARERDIAEALQRSLLFTPQDDCFPGLDVSSLYEAASEGALVGGDFSDAFACDHANVAIVLGDVMGHGLPAAMSTAELKYTLRGFVREHVHSGRILAQMNECVYESARLFKEGLNNLGNADPLALTLATINASTGHGTIAVAGMDPPLIVRANGELEVIDASGLLIGVLPTELYTETSFSLGRGDCLVLATDGVTEARSGLKFFGYDGLMDAVSRTSRQPNMDRLVRGIFQAAHEFAGGLLRDDVCIIALHRH